MDCFYVAVERARDPRLNGKPCAVVQYNTNERGRPDVHADADRWHPSGPIGNSMGGIIAVSYEARARGVTRQMMGKEARKTCPEVILVQVPTAFGKADLRIYKAAGDEVVALLAKRADATEKRSVDEVAVDITSEAERILAERDWFSDIVPAARQSTHLGDSAVSRQAASVSRNDTRKGHDGQLSRGGLDEDFSWESLLHEEPLDPIVKRLVAGAVVIAELRKEVKTQLGFSCSGGVATNKVLAKLGCGLHKPDQQTILLPYAVPLLLHSMPIDRLPGLGGDLGASVMSEIGVKTAGELVQRRTDVLTAFPEKGEWIVGLASGMDSAADAVKDRQLVKSLSNGKTFFGRNALRTVSEVEYWLRAFAGELHQRYMEQILQHQRAPSSVGIQITSGSCSGWQNMKGNTSSCSRQQPISLGRCGTVAEIASAAISCFHRWFAGTQSQEFYIVTLGLNLGKFVDLESSVQIQSFFCKAGSTSAKTSTVGIGSATEATSTGKLQGKSSVGSGSIRAFFAKTSASASSAPVRTDAEPVQNQHPSRGCEIRGLDASQVDEAVFAELPLSIQKEIAAQLRLPQHHIAKCTTKVSAATCDVATPQRKKLRRDCPEEIVEIEID